MKTTDFEEEKKYTRTSLCAGSFVVKSDAGCYYLTSLHFGENEINLTEADMQIDDWKEF